MELENRVVVLIDMDCFYCQVEEKLDPDLKGKPIAVVQYNPWKGGGIIAVNYVARAMGVTRHMRGDEAKEKCPEILLPSVPCVRGKADISKYRDAGKEVARVLQKFTPLLERASIDEAYLDVTAPVEERLKTLNIGSVTTELMPNTYALGYESISEFILDVHQYGNDSIDFDYDHAKRLLIGAVVVSEIRAAVYEETGYRCTAGIAHNKILAKLVCGMNKPNKQTILPKHSVNILYKTLSVKKVKHLGGKFGDTVCEILKINTMGELQKFTEKELQARFDEKNGTWLYNIARGIDLEPVQARFNPKSIGCCKQLRGKSAVTDLENLRKWLKDLSDEIEDRLEKDALENNRTPKQMVLSYSSHMPDGRDTSSSRSYNFTADDDLCGDFFAAKALELCIDSLEGAKVTAEEPNRKLRAPIKFLGISVGKFEDNSESKKTRKINDYFGASSSNANKTKETTAKRDENKDMNKSASGKNEGKEYILQKFFQTAAEKKKPEDNVKDGPSSHSNAETIETKPVVESPLHIQESFFTKLLNKSNKTVANIRDDAKVSSLRPTTPQCNVVECGDDSNDTEYSTSTINVEIDKSIALFEEDPQDVARVSSIRELLHTTKVSNDSSDELQPQETVVEETTENNSEQERIQVKEQTFTCPECKKALPLSMVETHADYHFALKLREEERQRVRDEYKQKTKPKTPTKKEEKRKKTNEEVKRKTVKEETSKNDTGAPITNFFIKIDDRIPTETCTECGKRVPVEKLTEHLDFHEAQKLSRKLNKKPISAKFLTGSSVKRKRATISPVKKSKLPCTSRSIDSFFR